MRPPLRIPDHRTVGRLLAVLAVAAASIAVAALLLPDPLADVFVTGILLGGVGFSVVGAVGAWTNRPALAWVGALLFAGLTAAGMMTVGAFLVPPAALLFGAAAFAHLDRSRADDREQSLADPPAGRTVVGYQVVGAGAVLLGVVLVYVGAFARHLFGACARETLGCVLETTNWGAVGVTLLGTVGVVVGAWLLWRQAHLVRVLASTRGR